MFIKIFMRNKYRNKNVYYLSNNYFSSLNNIPINNFYRINKNKEDPKRYREKFAITSKRKEGKLIWFHGASVGELLILFQ